jgi:Tfp pilus assembly protein PilX
MLNDKGYAIVLVLLFLAVISLLGVGLMQMSRLDLQFTGAVKNYNKLFNLADGACAIAYEDLKGVGSRQGQVQYTGPAPLGSGPALVPVPPTNTTDADNTLWNPLTSPFSYPYPGKQYLYPGQSAATTGKAATVGKYYVMEYLQGYNDSSYQTPGYEAGQGSSGYHMEYWTGEGHANRGQGNLVVEVAYLKFVQN